MASPAAAVPETFGYRLKRKILGPPLVSEAIESERLSNPIAMGVLSCDMISSSAYGTEEMLTVLVPAVGTAAFTLVLPITGVILLILLVVTLSYREVVMVYTKAGGSYVVARENFGIYTAQFAAVALLIDYTVTVAVQVAAGTDALSSAFPSLGTATTQTVISVAVVCLLIYGNLRGIREAGRTFAVPTYLFIASMILVVAVGLSRAAFGHLHVYSHDVRGAIPFGHGGGGVLEGASVFIMLRALANGGSSLTGLEAISNSVAAFRHPEGPNARKVLAWMSLTLGCLVFGVSLLAHYTHAFPYVNGSPTVISQVAKAAFGSGPVGQAGFYAVQATTLLILYTGGNTSFNGFPFLANFVAEDRFLPRPFSKRGHRLVFSNGIVFLGTIAIILLVVTHSNVDSLVALYAIGVFTGFTMAGTGMVKYHLSHREDGWRHKLAINGLAGLVSGVVVIIFAVTKFTQGAWVVLVLFPILMFVLIRTHRQYTTEEKALGEGGVAEEAITARPLPRHMAVILVDRMDLATVRAIQYGKTLLVDELTAVHFVLDPVRAQRIENRWVRLGLSRLPLQLRECPDRRVERATLELANEMAADGNTEVTVLLPRRAYGFGLRRILHDATADRIASAVSRLPHVNATIVPFDVRSEIHRSLIPGSEDLPARSEADATAEVTGAERKVDEKLLAGVPGTIPLRDLQPRQSAKVAGRVRAVTVQPWGDTASLQVELTDDVGTITLAFLGRRQIAGLVPGSRIVASGTVGDVRGRLAIVNPDYEFLATASSEAE